MHRRIPLLIATLFVVSIAGWGLARASTACPGCTYVPLIRAEIHPTDPPTATLEPTATPIAPNLHVRSYRMFPDSLGDLIVAGEIENGTNKPVYSVKVIGKFYDDSGVFLATEYTYALLTRTSPGQRVPFRLYLNNAPVGITHVDLTLSASASSFLVYYDVAVLSQQARDNSGVEVFGEVQNVAPKTLQNAKIAVTFYDGAGNVFNTDWGYATISPLPSGATSTYQVATFSSQLNGLPFSVQAQGYAQ